MEISNEYNFKYTPHMILLSLIFFFKYFSKAREESQNLNPEKKMQANRIYYRYLICFQLAKAADWCLGPFMYEFFQTYHNLKTEMLAKLIALSFFSSLFMGPFIVGYLNDKSDKKFPCMVFGIALAFSCLVRQIKNPGMLVLGQISYGLCSPLLYTSFENWFIGETNIKVEDKKIRENVIANAFEK
jgi:Sugar-tranasporters, 12 TM